MDSPTKPGDERLHVEQVAELTPNQIVALARKIGQERTDPGTWAHPVNFIGYTLLGFVDGESVITDDPGMYQMNDRVFVVVLTAENTISREALVRAMVASKAEYATYNGTVCRIGRGNWTRSFDSREEALVDALNALLAPRFPRVLRTLRIYRQSLVGEHAFMQRSDVVAEYDAAIALLEQKQSTETAR